MVPILSFKLLPNKKSDGVGTPLVKGTSFDGKILLKVWPSNVVHLQIYHS